ncbi:uncharacterized protein BXZ73DRAFT_45033 [Epithele typhae]|uniref:uncharacterized protein n=1 Tax=Epithele typhae TaxID=378194 RepID=UPI002007F38F|nr:uncharacterized protein BXZ73DRAFT_45033 [Epithele typhae]KAH9936820.1 hypothetical protein BXZ73DRAFT_45033 [Epithele typhae]
MPREQTPSPSFREKQQRTHKAHSLPNVPSLNQILANSGGQMMYPQPSQPSPTASNSSHQSRRSPPPTSRISPTAAKLPNERVADLQGSSPPPLMHSHSTPAVPQHASAGIPNPHHPRPMPRGAPPAFIAQFATAEDKWAVTEGLMAEFERSSQAGAAGVAYAGGAASSGSVPTMKRPGQDPAGDRMRTSSKDGEGAQGTAKRVDPREMQPARESPQTRERSSTGGSQQLGGEGHVRTPEYRGSPQYQAPMASPGERSAGYKQYVPEGYPSPPLGPQAGPALQRKPTTADAAPSRLTPPAASKLASSTHTPPLQVMGGRPPDRSLPLQEEDNGHDEDHDETEYSPRTHGSPTPSSDLYPEGHPIRYDSRHEHDDDDDEGTLNNEDDDHIKQNKSEDSEAGYTPRSPSTTLPERARDGPYINQYDQKTIRPKHRSGIADQLGMRTFDPAMFERETVNSLRNGPSTDVPARVAESPSQASTAPPASEAASSEHQHPPHYDPREWTHGMGRILDQRMGYNWAASSAQSQSDDMQSLLDDPTSSYLQTFLRSSSARPGAPIPPTPQTGPSPSPLISAMPSDFEPRQIGSPYPYPFTHIRRSTMSGPLPAPSTNYDAHNPDVIREQLALQLQIYALNNGLAPPTSESAFSPSSTPFPGPGYNPWAFVPAGGGLGLGLSHQAMMGRDDRSMASSPSHEPVAPPPMRGTRRFRPEKSHLSQSTVPRGGARRVKPPPRVDSTQPRETSPEPSSGEETAGEERFAPVFAPSKAGSVTDEWEEATPVGAADDEGEWVEEGEEDGEEDDLLDLEFHPTYVSNPQKRRRRFDTRWDALVQAFQALDRETDATLVLLASPSHSTKLHALTSRSVRRDASLAGSPALTSARRAFAHLAAQRRAARKAQRMSLAERLSTRSASSADGSPGGGSPGELDLRRALETALGSLGALSSIYDQREARWREEMRRLNTDREQVELLLRQALGPATISGLQAGVNGAQVNGHLATNVNGNVNGVGAGVGAQ